MSLPGQPGGPEPEQPGMAQPGATSIRCCHACGLAQRVGDVPPRHVARCPRCNDVVWHARRPKRASTCAAIALAALILYPVAMMLPVLEVERLGHASASTIIGGVRDLIAEGSVAIGLIVLVCSVIVPLVKLLGMFVLCAGNTLLSGRHRALTYRVLEWIGRWGMIDVLLVATLVAVVKLGDFMEVTPGPGALAFCAVVLLSMLATASFDPASIWETTEREARA